MDAPRTPDDIDMLTDLSVWEIRLENLFRFGTAEGMLDLALLDSMIKCPDFLFNHLWIWLEVCS